jgi:hypothetical protein
MTFKIKPLSISGSIDQFGLVGGAIDLVNSINPVRAVFLAAFHGTTAYKNDDTEAMFVNMIGLAITFAAVKSTPAAKITQDRPLFDLTNSVKIASNSLQNVVNSSRAKMSPEKLVEDEQWRALPCFVAETLVHTDDEPVEIQWIRVGKKVLSRNEITGEQAYRRVTQTFVHEDVQIYHVCWITQLGDTECVSTTAEHPFWVNGIGWTEAARLQEGQLLEICDPDGSDEDHRQLGSWQELALSGERWSAKVVKVAMAGYKETVYNIEVEEFHTYFVGLNGAWVHNKGIDPVEIPLERSTSNTMPYSRYAPDVAKNE